MSDEISSLSIIFTEFYYWITVVLMFFIHIGFCLYEATVSRYKNHVHAAKKYHADPAGHPLAFLVRLMDLLGVHACSRHHRWAQP